MIKDCEMGKHGGTKNVSFVAKADEYSWQTSAYMER